MIANYKANYSDNLHINFDSKLNAISNVCTTELDELHDTLDS